MVSRLPGAIARALLVVLLIVTPSVLVPDASSDAQQIVALVAIFAAILTLVEYASSYPGLVEFRDAPPFNRVRFGSLFATVLVLAIIMRGHTDPTTLTEFVTAVGTIIGHSIDFPYSPVRLVVLMMPDQTDAALVSDVRTAAGISYLISLLSLTVFVMALGVNHWPTRSGAFNVWVNLPTFDPTAGGDVVERLNRDARINIALGFLLPFLIPAIVKLASNIFDPVSMSNSHTLIWTMTAWAFLPASLFMRGIAMGRVASMIEEKRKRTYAQAQKEQLQTA
ncbi:MAG: hypothetical protein AAFQ47_16700 [Pseudomonadota bacterium]|mgnify:FL=1